MTSLLPVPLPLVTQLDAKVKQLQAGHEDADLKGEMSVHGVVGC